MEDSTVKIVIPGGTGQVGTILTRRFVADGHEFVVLSRHARPATGNAARVVNWDARTLSEWVQEIDGSDVVINLAGRSVNCRYHAENRQQIIESRTLSTRVIGDAIRTSNRPPRVWLQSSTATIYAHRYDLPNDDETGILGGAEENVPETWRFSVEVAKAWEAAAMEWELPHTRRVLMRSAITFSPDAGSVFEILLNLVRRGLGGTNGDGRQYVSWIHDQDFIQAVCWLIEHNDFDGPVNLASPHPLPNAEFMRTLRDAWGIPFGLPATKWMLELAAFFMRTESELILKSRRVVPKRLLRSGFEFQFPKWHEAARDLCDRYRK